MYSVPAVWFVVIFELSFLPLFPNGQICLVHTWTEGLHSSLRVSVSPLVALLIKLRAGLSFLLESYVVVGFLFRRTQSV